MTPDLETIAAFLDGKLSGPAREEVIALLASDKQVFEVFASATAVPMSDGLTPEEVLDMEMSARTHRRWRHVQVQQLCREWRDMKATIARLERHVAFLEQQSGVSLELE